MRLRNSAISFFLLFLGEQSSAAELNAAECLALREFVFAASDVVESAGAIVRFNAISSLENYSENLGTSGADNRINESTELTASHNANVDALTRAMDGLRPIVAACR